MNRGLLLVICDFLILSLLALGSFDEPVSEGREADFGEQVYESGVVNAELLAALQLALEQERVSREDLSGDLTVTEENLREKERALAEREARLRELEGALGEREKEAEKLREERTELAERISEAEREKAVLVEERRRQEEETRRALDRALALERELQEKLAALERSEQELAVAEERQRQAMEENRELSAELRVSETERRLIRENLEHVRTEVQLVRAEKERIQQQAGELAQGVTALAERSDELAKEFRGSQPKTANMIFSDFQANRLEATFMRDRSRFLREQETKTGTILVTDGEAIFALFHVESAGLSPSRPVEWETLSAQLSASGRAGRIRRFSFLSLDPRLMAVEISPAVAEQFGVEVYPLAREPFRFPEAVLVSGSGDYYGESTFTLDAENDRYLQMPRRIMSRLFGEFSPTRGDLVFSKTGELLGIMVNDEYCVLIDNFLPVPERGLEMGENLTGVGDQLRWIGQRVNQLPRRFR